MKKLMTMLAAAAMAFGLYADGERALNAAFNASSLPAGTYTPDSGWAAYSGAAGTLNIVNDDEPRVLEIKTGTAELARKVATDGNAWAITNLYLEASIDFQEQALEDVPTNISADDKIALFILDTSEIEGAPGTTNLFAMAGYGANGKALFNLGKVDESWFAKKKVAIKAYDNVFQNDKRTGFLVSVANGTTVEPLTVRAVYQIVEGAVSWTNAMGDDYLNLGEDIKLVSKVSKWAKQGDDYRKLLFSMAKGDTRNGKLTSVGFVGNAQIASVGFTETDPGFGSDSVGMPLSVTDGVTFALTAASKDAGFDTDGTSSITGPASGETFTFTVAKGDFDNVTVSFGDAEITPVSEIYTATLTPGETALTVKGWDTGATVTIGGVDKNYENLPDAIIAANGAGAIAEISLARDATGVSGKQTFSNAFGVVLDLNGKAFKGEAGINPFIENTGVLTIKDSASNGYIQNTKSDSAIGVQNKGTLEIQSGEMKSVVKNNADAAVLTVTGGLFNNELANTKGNLTITGGKFIKENNSTEEDPPAFKLEDCVDKSKYAIGSETIDNVDYWTVTEDTTVYVAQVVVTDGDEVTNKYATAVEALAAVQAAEEAGQFPIKVTALTDDGLTITDGDNTAKIAKDVTIGINKIVGKELWVVFGNLEYSGTIDGKLDADEITMPAGTTTIALGVNAIVTVKEGTALTAASFTVPTGYMVKKEEIEDTFVQFSVDEIVATVQANGATEATPFFDVADALTEVQLLEQDEAHFPIGVTAVKDLEIVGPNGQTITLAAGGIIGINKDAWVITGTVAGEVTLAVGKSITVVATSTLKVNAPAGDYKVVADTSVEGLVTYTVVEKTYVAQIGDDGEKFETLAEAVAAVADGQTIKLLKDCPAVENEALMINADNVTLDLGGFTLTHDLVNECTFGVADGKTVTVTNGTVTMTSGSYGFHVGTNAVANIFCKMEKLSNSNPVIDIFGGTLNCNELTELSSKSDVIRTKEPDSESWINISGGTYYTTQDQSIGIIHHYKNHHKLNLTITGGYFDAKSLIDAYKAKAEEDGPTLVFTKFDENTAARFSDATLVAVKDNSIITEADIIAAGCKTKKVDDKWYGIAKIQYATLAVTADEGITYVLTNKTTDAVVENGYKADIDNAEVIEAIELGFAEGYELDPASVLTTTLNTATPAEIVLKKQLKTFAVTFSTNNYEVVEAATTAQYGQAPVKIPSFTGGTWDVDPTAAVITCATNFNYTIAAPAPVDPVDPEEPKTYDDDTKAKAAADAINADKPSMIKSPEAAGLTGEAHAAYAARFVAVADGNTVTVQLLASEKTALETQAANDTKAIPVSNIAAAEDDTEQQIDATPGFFYSVIANDSLEGMKVRSCECAKGNKVTVTIPHYENSGFYTIKASVKEQTTDAAFVEDK